MLARMAYETLLTDLTDGIFTLTLNRPDRLNAFTAQMMDDYLRVLDDIDADDDVRVVIVTGAGRGFCAGADLGGGNRTFDSGGGPGGDEVLGVPRDGGGRVTLRLFDCTKPVIAAINGPAVGVGITQTLPMDIRLASDRAKMGFVFARRGLVPEACSSWFLPRVVGISKAMEWIATGRVFSAEEAHAAGLVSELLPHDELLPRARALAAEIAENTSAVSVALSRQMLWKMLGADHPMEAHRIDSRGIHFMGSSPDAREGVQSFLDKRSPSFKMRVSKDMPDYFPWWEEARFEDDPE
jgi:enoyl-CoA hydratase/carnithine racemase